MEGLTIALLEFQDEALPPVCQLNSSLSIGVVVGGLKLNIEQSSKVPNPRLRLVFITEHKLISIIAYTILNNNLCSASVWRTENTIAIWRHYSEFARDYAKQSVICGFFATRLASL